MFRNKKLEFSYNHVYNKILLKEINFIEKMPSQNKCIIHMTNDDKKFIISTISKLKKELQPLFFQTHKACIVNLSNIKYIDYANYNIYFKNGQTTNLLTPTARKELKENVRNY